MFEDLVKEKKDRTCPYCDTIIGDSDLVCVNCWDELLIRVRKLKDASEKLLGSGYTIDKGIIRSI